MGVESVLAHAFHVPRVLPLPPPSVATLAVFVLLAATATPTLRPARQDTPAADHRSRSVEHPGRLWLLGRLAGIALLALALAAGASGEGPLTAVLVVWVAWPLLLLASSALGQVWSNVDPFDTGARLLARLAGQRSPTTVDDPPVTWALVPALGWLCLLNLPFSAGDSRIVAATLAGYTAFLLTGSLTLGRRSWLLRADVVGLVLGWVGRIRRRGLVAWTPPRSAELVLGVLAGGLLVTSFRASTFWHVLPRSAWSPWYPFLAIALAGAAFAWGARAMERWAGRLGGPGSVSAALVPTVAMLGVAVALTDHRLLLGLQALPALLTDPFNRGWDPIGAASWGVNPQPLGQTGLVLAQILLLVTGAIAGARTAHLRVSNRRAADPAMAAVSTLLALGVLSIAAT